MGNSSSSVIVEGHSLRVKSQLGEGGRGNVYLAEDEARRKFALKVLRVPKDDASANHLAEMELEHHAQLPPHPHVVTFVGSKVDKTTEDPTYNVYYILTEYCPKTVQALLEAAVKKKEPLAERDILYVFTSAVAAVGHLHDHQLAHRDVKVENLLIGAVDGFVKLCDLGSCSTDHRKLRNSTEIGYAQEDIEKHTTLAYRAPEQVDLYSGKVVGEKVDIWALGVLLYKLCWWRTPFEDKSGVVSSMAIINGKYKAPPSSGLGGSGSGSLDKSTGLPPYSPGIVALIRCLLEPDPDLRPTAGQVLDRVRELMEGGEIGCYSDLPALGPMTTITAAITNSGSSSTTTPSPSMNENEEDLLGMFETATNIGASTPSPISSRRQHHHHQQQSSASRLGNGLADLSLSLSRTGSPSSLALPPPPTRAVTSPAASSSAMPPPILFTPSTTYRGGGGPSHHQQQHRGSNASNISRRESGGVLDLSASSSLSQSRMGTKSQSFVRFNDVWKEAEDDDGIGLDWTMGAGDLATTRRASHHDHNQETVGLDISELVTINRARSPPLPRVGSSSSLSGMYDETTGRPKNPKKALGVLWQRRMKSIMGGGSGEKGKKSWVVKATSKEPGQPKAKYVRKIVLAVWEHQMSSSTFFIYLYQRPVQSNPVVSLKGLITTLKVLQQGPRDFLGECVPCVGILDEIGRHWGNIGTKVANDPTREQLTRSATAEGYTTTVIHPGHGASSPSHKRQHLDASSIDLLARFARLLVQKLYFHEQHPAFATHFTAIPTMLGYETVPVTGSEEDMKALSRLLTIQDTITQVPRLIFAAKNESVATTARWALLPLIEEAYTVFVACTFLLASLLELSARASAGLLPLPLPRRGKVEVGATASSVGLFPPMAHPVVDWQQRVTALLALREQYEGQLLALQGFYAAAERVEEVKAMKRVPTLPVSVPVALDGALNWKPSTMRSPMRGLGLLERARMNEEEAGRDSSGSGPPTPRAAAGGATGGHYYHPHQQQQHPHRRSTLTPTITANALAALEDGLPLSSSSGEGGSGSISAPGGEQGGNGSDSGSWASSVKFAPVPAPPPSSSSSSSSPSTTVRLTVAPPPPPPSSSMTSSAWEAFNDTVGFSSPSFRAAAAAAGGGGGGGGGGTAAVATGLKLSSVNMASNTNPQQPATTTTVVRPVPAPAAAPLGPVGILPPATTTTLQQPSSVITPAISLSISALGPSHTTPNKPFLSSGGGGGGGGPGPLLPSFTFPSSPAGAGAGTGASGLLPMSGRGGKAGGEAGGSRKENDVVWFLPSSVQEAPGLSGLGSAGGGGAEREKKAHLAASMVVSATYGLEEERDRDRREEHHPRSSSLDDFLSTTGKLEEEEDDGGNAGPPQAETRRKPPLSPTSNVHMAAAAAAAAGEGEQGGKSSSSRSSSDRYRNLPPRMSIAGIQVGVKREEEEANAGGDEDKENERDSANSPLGGKRRSVDLLEWTSSSSEEEDDDGDDEMDDSMTNEGSIAALNTENMSRIMGIGGGGGSAIIMGASGPLGSVDGEEGKGYSKEEEEENIQVRRRREEQAALEGEEGESKNGGGEVVQRPSPHHQDHQPPQQPSAQQQQQQQGQGGVLASTTAPPPPPPPPPATSTASAAHHAPAKTTEDKQVKVRRREARAQPWRANMKPAVAVALSSIIREFETMGNLIAPDEIMWGETIGHGAFATVYRGYCRGQDVAVKKLITQNGLPMAEKSVRDFSSEVNLLRLLHHPNIIAFVGTCLDPVSVLTEFCHKGNLFMVLNEKARYKEIGWTRKLSIARGLADGMHYLHTRDPILIHRDLKSLNVLLNRDWVVKITDFGLSRFKPHSLSDIMTMQCGTYHWMAPEVINSTKYTEKADVYSFGIILWEIYSRAIPYDGMQPVQVVAAVINRVERPPLPRDCPPEYAALVRACWAHDPADRPSFSEIVDWLRGIPG